MAPPVPPGAAPAASFASLPSPLDAVDDLRSAAQWTIVAAGAVGTALIGGGPLVAIGKVHGLPHAIIAGASLVVALAGVGLAVWKTSQVLVPPVTTPATLSKSSLDELQKIINDAPWFFFGVVARNVEDLLRHRPIAVNLARQVAEEKDPVRRGQLEVAMRRALANAERADPYVSWLLATAHVWQIREALRRAQRYTLIGGVLVAVAAAAFFSVTGDQGPVYVPVVTPQITAVPTVHPT